MLLPGVIATAAGGGSYEGPLDLVPGAASAYAHRALSAAMLGSALFSLRRVSDEEEEEFSSDAETGDAPTAEIAAFLGASDSRALIWNDQSGNGHDLNCDPENVNLIEWTPNLIDSKPGFATSAGQTFRSETFVSFPNGGITIFCLCNNKIGISEVGSNVPYFDFVVFDTDAFIDMSDEINQAGGSLDDTIPSGLHIWEAAWEFGSRSFMADGVEKNFGGTYDSGGPLDPFTMQIDMTFENETEVVELLIWPLVLSGAQRTSIRQNIAAYYGITLA